MQERKLEIYLFFVLLGVASFLTFKIFEPYLYALILALIFSVIFHPLHKKILMEIPKHHSLSALLTLFIVFMLVLLPLVLFGVQITDDIKNIYEYALVSGGGQGFVGNVTNIANNIINYFNPTNVNPPLFDVTDTENYALGILTWLRGHFGDIFSGLAKFFVNLFIFTISFFYFIKDGDRLRKDIIDLSPFKDDRDEEILNKLKIAIVSVVKGSVLVAMIQGLVSGLGFYIFGLPSHVFWGGVTAVAALVPGFGTSLVIGPAVLYLLFTGFTGQAIGLFIWGVLAVGFIDNFLGPKFIEQGIKIHPLLILLSALGGISFFGPVGFLLGPITISFLFALFDIYRNIIIRNIKA
jgi:predicted PurR-regulated permease PerM